MKTYATERAAAVAAKSTSHLQDFVTAVLLGGRYDWFPAGHPVGIHDESGNFQRCGAILCRYERFPPRKWWRATPRK